MGGGKAMSIKNSFLKARILGGTSVAIVGLFLFLTSVYINSGVQWKAKGVLGVAKNVVQYEPYYMATDYIIYRPEDGNVEQASSSSMTDRPSILPPTLPLEESPECIKKEENVGLLIMVFHGLLVLIPFIALGITIYTCRYKRDFLLKDSRPFYVFSLILLVLFFLIINFIVFSQLTIWTYLAIYFISFVLLSCYGSRNDWIFRWINTLNLCFSLLIVFLLLNIGIFPTVAQNVRTIILHLACFIFSVLYARYAFEFFVRRDKLAYPALVIALLLMVFPTLIYPTVIGRDRIKTASEYSTSLPSVQYEPYYKPVIYLYPPQKQKVLVQLHYQGDIIADYPAYNMETSGWEVMAYPDGRIINISDNKEYSYLFWEGIPDEPIVTDMKEGFIVKGEDTKEFLQSILAMMGLKPHEFNEFIVFWYPRMKDNKYNYIHFVGEKYTKKARLDITPEPDSILRVFMVYKALDREYPITPQEIIPFERKGFSVIEWGGTE